MIIQKRGILIILTAQYRIWTSDSIDLEKVLLKNWVILERCEKEKPPMGDEILFWFLAKLQRET